MKKIIISVPIAVPLYVPGVVGLPQVFTASSLRISIELRKHSSLDKKIVYPLLKKAVTILSKKYSEVSDEGIDLKVINPYPKLIMTDVSILSACVGGLLYWQRHLWNPQIVQEIIFQEFKKTRTLESGLIPASISGGVIWFRQELSFLTSTWQIFLPKTLLSKSFALTMFPPVHSIQLRTSIEWKDAFEDKCRNLAQALKSENHKEFMQSWRLAIKLLEQRNGKNKFFPLIHAFEVLGGAAIMWPQIGITVWYHQEVKTMSIFLKTNKILFSLVQLGAEGMRLEEHT